MSEATMLEREALPRNESRRGLGRAFVGVLGLLALSAGIGVLVWLLTYQPLVYGSGWNLPEARVVETVGLGTEYQYRASPAGTFDIAVQIKNTGPRSVTVQEVMPERHYYWRLKEVSLGLYGPEPYGNFGREFRPFTPQMLEPGDYLQLRLRYEFADCETEGGASSFSSFQVRYTATFLDRVAEIEFPFSVGIKNIGGDCGDKAFGSD